MKLPAFILGLITHDLDENGLEVTNPANAERLCAVKTVTAEDAALQLVKADGVMNEWQSRPAKVRSQTLKAWHDLILAHGEDLAILVTLEQGRVLKEARGEVAYCASFIDWFAEEAKRAYGRTIPAPVAGKALMTLKEPIGLCGAITPWNFPLSMITRKVAPALAAGCAIALKPSELTPLCALSLRRLAIMAGLPEDLFQVLVTDKPALIGTVLTSHELIKKFSFTGSTVVGKKLYEQCASGVRKVSLELGGNAPFMIFDDADLEAALDGLMASKFRNSGQTCVCANRILVQEGIYEAVLAGLKAKMSALRAGEGWLANTTIGPLISKKAADKVDRLINSAIGDGAIVEFGGKRLSDTMVQPTLLTNVTPNMRITQEEIFGPVACLMRFSSEEEAIKLANDTPSGLAAYGYTQSLSRAQRLMKALKFGMVGINDGVMSTEVAPFGGVKDSGLGREGAAEGLEEYLTTKFISIGGL